MGVFLKGVDCIHDFFPFLRVEDVCNTAEVCKRCLQEDGIIGNHAVFYDIFDNCIDEVCLLRGEVYFGSVAGKCGFCGMHVHSDYFAYEDSKRFVSNMFLVFFFCSDFVPEDFFELCEVSVG